MKMKLRYWMLFGMLIVTVVPRLVYEVPGLVDRYLLHPSQAEQRQAGMDGLAEEASKSGMAQWENPEWRSAVEKQASSLHLGIIVNDASGRERFQFMPEGSNYAEIRQIVFAEKGQLQGSMFLYGPKPGNGWGVALSIIAAAGVIVFIGLKIGRVVVRPLEATSAAARRIAGGDLDFELPTSTVAEVIDVRNAFHAMRNELQESLIRQSRLEEERRFFISAIAHDLRTPIFTLRGFLQRIEKSMHASPQKLPHYLEICSQKAEQLNRLVSDLSSYTVTDSLDLSMRRERIEMNRLLADLVAEYAPIAKEKKIDLRFNASPEAIALHADPHLIHRAIGNLMDNALRFTLANGKVTIHCSTRENKALFSIEDTGPGISAKEEARIFEPFYRSDESRNPEYGGTGLGLTIARRIIRAHHGELAVQRDTSDEGAVFAGWLPLASVLK